MHQSCDTMSTSLPCSFAARDTTCTIRHSRDSQLAVSNSCSLACARPKSARAKTLKHRKARQQSTVRRWEQLPTKASTQASVASDQLSAPKLIALFRLVAPLTETAAKASR